jgi:hypothetical protein
MFRPPTAQVGQTGFLSSSSSNLYCSETGGRRHLVVKEPVVAVVVAVPAGTVEVVVVPAETVEPGLVPPGRSGRASERVWAEAIALGLPHLQPNKTRSALKLSTPIYSYQLQSTAINSNVQLSTPTYSYQLPIYSIKLQHVAARRGFRAPVEHSFLVTDLISEDHRTIALGCVL